MIIKMYRPRLIIIFFCFIFIFSCSNKQEKVVLVKETNQKQEMISNYKDGMNLLEIGD